MTGREIGAVWAPRILSVLRIMAGLLFMQHGAQKLLGFPTFPANGAPAMGTLLWFGGVIELLGGFLIAIGLLTRPTAFVASGMTAVAYWMFHAGRGFFPILNAGELAALYSFAFLYLAAAGGGPWSVDALIGRSKTL